jgi:hypothetical protein
LLIITKGIWVKMAMRKRCRCGCGLRLRMGAYRKGHWLKCHRKELSNRAKRLHRKYPNLSRDTMKHTWKLFKKYREKEVKAWCSLGGKTTKNRHPNLAKKAGAMAVKSALKSYPNFHIIGGKKGGHIGGKRMHILWKRKDPESYYSHQRNATACSNESRRKKSPFVWYRVGFLSKEERLCAKRILKRPISGKNCHVKVGSKIIDFFPGKKDKMFRGKFVEYHPWDRVGRTLRQYQREREEAIANSPFDGRELIVLTEIPR